MKVKCYISSIIEKEVEIDDKFKALAVERPWEQDIPNQLYEEAIDAVEKATGAQARDDEANHFICSVEDSETGILMLEG
jgi:hypothetical protein